MKNTTFFILLSILIMSLKSNNDSYLLCQQALLNHLSNLNTDTVYVLKCFDIELPSKIGKYTVIDISENTSSFLKEKSSLCAIKLLPIEINKGNIEITLIDYVLECNDGKILMSNAGSVIYCYKFESQTRKYKLLKEIKNTI